MSDLILSASSLDKFFSCPRQFELSKLWTPIAEPTKALKLGLDVHAIMAGQKRVTKNTPNDVRWHVKQMKSMEKGYSISEREIEDVVPLTDGIKILRRRDAIGVAPNGEEVVIDYKTATYMWDEYDDGVYPKAEGFQTACYMLGDGPSRMDYFVSAENGLAKVVVTYDNLGRFGELLDAAKIVKNAVEEGRYPAHRGWLCRYCAYTGPCFDVSGWDTMYTARKERKDDSID